MHPWLTVSFPPVPDINPLFTLPLYPRLDGSDFERFHKRASRPKKGRVQGVQGGHEGYGMAVCNGRSIRRAERVVPRSARDDGYRSGKHQAAPGRKANGD